LTRQLQGDQNFHAGKETEFMIRHYAGEVAYTVEGFLDKNNDLLFPNLIKMATDSKLKLLKMIFEADQKALAASNKRPPTSCVQFKKQVTDLMTTLKSCNQHYIRCIKPNDKKRPNIFDQKLVFTQVTYLGLLENVTVRRAGYAARVSFEKFLSKYKACGKSMPSIDDPKGGCSELMNHLGFKDFVLGHTKIFIRSPKTLFKLEDMRQEFLANAAARLPPEEGMIYAEKVYGYDQKEKAELLFCISSKSCYLIRGAKMLFKINTTELQGLTVGDKKDGYLILHCKEALDEKELKKAKPREPLYWNLVIECVFKEELLQVCEMLKTSGVTIDIRKEDITLDPETMNSRFTPDLKGTKDQRGKCVVM